MVVRASAGTRLRDHDGSLIAVATEDPLDPRTFSGYSSHLFRAVEAEGIRIEPVASRRYAPIDALAGAVSPRAALSRTLGSRNAALLRPDWYWSSAAFHTFSARFDKALERLTPVGTMLQVGTHVLSSRSGIRSFCVTDATVVQMAGLPWFSIGRASRRAVRQAVESQAAVLHSCEKVFVLSKWAANSVVSDFGYPAERVVVVGAGANLLKRLPRHPDRNRPYILFVGYDWDRKGGPQLVDAFRLVRRRMPQARLVIAGCSPAVREPGVEIVGELDKRSEYGRDALLSLYSGASCFCLLSEFDPFPNVILEAGYMGVPVVSSRQGSRAEIVEQGVTGLLTDDRSPESVAEALLTILGDPETGDRMGVAARSLVESHYTWPKVAGRILAEMGMLPISAGSSEPDPIAS